MFRITSVILVSLTLLGCSHFDTPRKSEIQPGHSFVLNQAVEITPGSTRRFIQQGKFTTRSGFDRQQQHCRIEVRTLSEQSQIIQPDRFEITRVRFDSERIAETRPVMLASNIRLGIGFSFGTQLGFNNDAPPETMELIAMDLYSEHQPDVMRLVCAGSLSDGHPIDYPHNLRPGLHQIKLILGEIGQLEL
ncbi:hypothetical protein JX580_10990 [Thiomicrospira microaerophila]|uniref:hypothetical protein n=1 Tax=Thiomicrospira microaerophila TaxID=406020 RepID=UPI00200CA153|nr:hypothetical protein [Thiomicrospira microaerophila]UQB42166.1 hypothetical protein JX580_10990 [Thiomicrospira microaerophila]